MPRRPPPTSSIWRTGTAEPEPNPDRVGDLDHDEACQKVRVPATAAMWSTWKRPCAAVGILMDEQPTPLHVVRTRGKADTATHEPLASCKIHQSRVPANASSACHPDRGSRSVRRSSPSSRFASGDSAVCASDNYDADTAANVRRRWESRLTRADRPQDYGPRATRRRRSR